MTRAIFADTSAPKGRKPARPCCTACGRAFPAPKPTAEPVGTSELSDAELFAYYKRTALRQDLRFYLNLPSSDALRARIVDATPSKATNAAIAQAWREERTAEDRARKVPPVGSSVCTAAEWIALMAGPVEEQIAS